MKECRYLIKITTDYIQNLKLFGCRIWLRPDGILFIEEDEENDEFQWEFEACKIEKLEINHRKVPIPVTRESIRGFY